MTSNLLILFSQAGQGNFGHEGRPGQVGGSAPNNGKSNLSGSNLRETELNIRNEKTEHIFLYGKDGTILDSLDTQNVSGDVAPWVDDSDMMTKAKGGIITH